LSPVSRSGNIAEFLLKDIDSETFLRIQIIAIQCLKF
jgi:hypothetical protein